MKAVIFDMDGVLIDSEPLWRFAEKKIFARVGITLTDEMCVDMMGRRIDEVVSYWFDKYPWAGKSTQEVAHEIVRCMVDLVEAKGTALEGVYEALELIKSHQLKIGLASSSPKSLIDAVTRKLDIHHYFDIVRSAKDEKMGKPHPAVYLTAARELGVCPRDCIAFEDSIAGIYSAKSAGMLTIAVPFPEQYQDKRFEKADFKLKSLSEFTADFLRKIYPTLEPLTLRNGN